MEPDLIVDVDERDLILDAPEVESLAVDAEERDFILDAGESEFTAEFGAVGLPGPSNYALWLAEGNTGTLEDFLQAYANGAATQAQLALKADKADPSFTGMATFENVTVNGAAKINGASILDGGNF